MKRLLLPLLLLSLNCVAHAADKPPYELIITHTPENIDIIKQCGNVTQVQSVQIEKKETDNGSSFHYSSAMSVASSSDSNKPAKNTEACTLTIRSHQACEKEPCRKTLDFVAAAAK